MRVYRSTRHLALGAALGAAPFAGASTAQAQLKVVTSTTDLYDIAKAVGGNKITATHIGEGYQDPHFIEAKPSFVLQLRKADVFALVGLDLEAGWAPLLIDGARNPRIRPGGSGYLDVSKAIPVLDAVRGTVDRSAGDVHPLGNPHYWLEPGNGRRMAQAIKDKLTELSPGDKAYFDQRYADFDRRLADGEKRWDAAMAPYKGTKIVTYHRSWPNFMERFGLNVMGYVEPKPGIPPSPTHTIELIDEMKRQGAKLIVVEPYFDLKTPQAIANQIGGKVLVLAPSVGGTKEAEDYIKLFDYNVAQLTLALKGVTGK